MRASSNSSPVSIEPYLNRLRELPFVQHIALDKSGTTEFDGYLEITTPTGKSRFAVEVKRSYLDVGIARAIVARAQVLRSKQGTSLLLLARYISPAIGERLLMSEVNFLDLAGNMNVALGQHFHRTVIGKRESSPERTAFSERLTPAKVQLVVTAATYPESARWTVRKLGDVAGVGKSLAAKNRDVVLRSGLAEVGDRWEVIDPSTLRDQVVFGYTRLLRPRIFIGRYRSQHPIDRLLDNVADESKRAQIRYSLTGGPAADRLQHFYRGAELPLYISDVSDDWLRQFGLLPDRAGSVVLLRSFGEVVFWKEVENVWLAPPWLIYAELMSSDDPRGAEAGEKIREELIGQK
jgi:hypothetical protein